MTIERRITMNKEKRQLIWIIVMFIICAAGMILSAHLPGETGALAMNLYGTCIVFIIMIMMLRPMPDDKKPDNEMKEDSENIESGDPASNGNDSNVTFCDSIASNETNQNIVTDDCTDNPQNSN